MFAHNHIFNKYSNFALFVSIFCNILLYHRAFSSKKQLANLKYAKICPLGLV